MNRRSYRSYSEQEKEEIRKTFHEYGIMQEDSDIRAHVSVVNREVYVFPTENAKAIIKISPAPQMTFAYLDGIEGPSGEGWLVEPDWIRDIRVIKYDWPHWDMFDMPNLTTSDQGRMAERCVCDMIKNNEFPLWLKPIENLSKQVQINGTDIVLAVNKRIQIKCDSNGGYKHKDGRATGNLYLQKSEKNPKKAH